MPTNTDVPEVKLAKVNQDRERKKGGVALPGGTGSGAAGVEGVSGSVATASFRAGGSGILSTVEGVFGKSLAALLPKIMVMAMVSCLGYGAVSVGRALRVAAEIRNKQGEVKPKAFAAKPAANVRTDGVSGVVSTQGTQDSLRMVGGGLYGDPNAQAAAQAAADAKAKNDAAAPADQPNAAAAPAGGPANPMDPSAMAAAAVAGASGKSDKKDGAGQKGFGAFSGQLGGGGSSGHSFGANTSLAANQGGGVKGFGPGGAGVSRMSSPMAHAGGGMGRGLGIKQLAAAASMSRAAARSGVPETMSANGTSAFQPGVGSDSAITGGGAGTGAGSGSGSTQASTPSGSSGGAGSAGGGNPSLSGDGAGVKNDNCSLLFPNGNFVNSTDGGCVCPGGQDSSGSGQCSTPGHSNAAPWQKMSDMAKWLLIAAGALLLIASLIGYLARSGGALTMATWYPIAKYMCYIAMVMAGIATLLGISMAIMGGGAETQGIIYAIGGAITTACAYMAADGFEPKSPTTVSAQATNGTLQTNANGVQTQSLANGTTNQWVPTTNAAGAPTGGMTYSNYPTPGFQPTAPTTVTPYGSGAVGGDYGGAGWGLAGGGSGVAGGGIGGAVH